MSRLTPAGHSTETWVRTLHTEYGEAADARDFLGMVACFHPDSTLVTSSGRVLQGRHKLSEFFHQWVSSAPPTRHECSDHHPVRGTDWILSRCRSRVVRPDSDTLLLVATYYDVLVRDGDRWLIGSRIVSPSGASARDNESSVEVDP